MQDPRLTYLNDVYRLLKGNFMQFCVRAATGKIRSSLDIQHQIRSVWNFSYSKDMPKALRLYDLAKQNAWNPMTDIDWTERGNVKDYWMEDEADLICKAQFATYLDEETRLSLDRLARIWSMSQILHGEQAALHLSGQLLNYYEDIDGKLFLASQVLDEARHIEAFRHYLEPYSIHAIDKDAKIILDTLFAQPDWKKKTIGMLVLLEGYAMGFFTWIKRYSKDPLLKKLLHFTAMDEGRHVSFGMMSVGQRLETFSIEEREDLEDFALSVCRLLTTSNPWGGGLRDIRDIMWERVNGKIPMSREEFDLDFENNPAAALYKKEVFGKSLLQNLKGLGLMSERMLPHYSAMGLYVEPPSKEIGGVSELIPSFS